MIVLFFIALHDSLPFVLVTFLHFLGLMSVPQQLRTYPSLTQQQSTEKLRVNVGLGEGQVRSSSDTYVNPFLIIDDLSIIKDSCYM